MDMRQQNFGIEIETNYGFSDAKPSEKPRWIKAAEPQPKRMEIHGADPVTLVLRSIKRERSPAPWKPF
jgi:hypothetical protein